MPHIIRRKLILFDLLCEHDPPGTPPGESIQSSLRLQCWLKKIPATDPNQAAAKAERFLVEQRGVRNIKVKRWRFSRRERRGVQPNDGTVFT